MPDTDFKVNEFRTYEAKVEGVSLGFINTGSGGYAPSLGETLQYDGITVILKDGREFSDVPQLRSAIKSGWFVRVGDEVTTYRPKSAGIKVRATTQTGRDAAKRTEVVTEMSDERSVGSVSARKQTREATNLEATRRVPLETAAAQDALDAVLADNDPDWTSGDEEVDEIADILTAEMEAWADMHRPAEYTEIEEELDYEDELAAAAEADVMDMLDWVESDEAEVAPTAEVNPKRKTTKKKVSTKSAPRLAIDAKDSKAAIQKTARRLPVDVQDDRKSMPIVRDESDTADVVGRVADQKRTVIEREQEIALKDVAAAKPAEAPKPRIGQVGALVVDEQRDMGTIALSNNSAPIRLDESAKVKPTHTETVRMGEAQVGTQKTASKAPAVNVEGGVAVGRILSPTTTSFVATDSNTSSTAIQRTQEGKSLRVERFQTDEQVVGNVSEGATTKVAATGDVQEAQAGDSLEEILPDAAKGPEPEVYKRPEDDPVYAAMKAVIPDFEWDRDRPMKVKVAAALKYIENPQYLKAILAVESTTAQEAIKKALAEALEARKKGKKKAK